MRKMKLAYLYNMSRLIFDFTILWVNVIDILYFHDLIDHK